MPGRPTPVSSAAAAPSFSCTIGNCTSLSGPGGGVYLPILFRLINNTLPSFPQVTNTEGRHYPEMASPLGKTPNNREDHD